MLFEIKADGDTVVKIELELEQLRKLFHGDTSQLQLRTSIPTSTPMTRVQAEELLSKVDPKSARFLRQIAANNGSITWDSMREIFGIAKKDDWNAYALSYGKGITRAFRHLLQSKSARLVWWIDDDWKNEPWGSDLVAVYVDGPALQALQEAST